MSIGVNNGVRETSADLCSAYFLPLGFSGVHTVPPPRLSLDLS